MLPPAEVMVGAFFLLVMMSVFYVRENPCGCKAGEFIVKLWKV